MDRSINHQSLLGRTFDSYQNMMQIARCLREAAQQLSLARPRVLELSRRETGVQEYAPEAQVVRYPTHENDKPILSMPVALPFADKSFDACFLSDLYEHLPSDLRPSLLQEMLRVTQGVVLVGCPQGNEIVSKFDKVVFDFIWGKYAERYEPLEQHVEFGLEPVEQIIESLKAHGADQVTRLPCNYVYRWIHLILIYFDLQHKNPCCDFLEPFNRIYNEYLSLYDYREPCYRYLIVVATHPGLDINLFDNALKIPGEMSAIVAETDGVLVQTFHEIEAGAADRLRESSKEIERLACDNRWAVQEIEHLNSIIQKLQHDNCWAKQEIERLNAIIRGTEGA